MNLLSGGFSAFVSLISILPAYSQDEGLDAARHRFADFFRRTAELGVLYSPPGKNAASGLFRDAMQTDPTIMAILDNKDTAYTPPVSDEAVAIEYAFTGFAARQYEQFNIYPNVEGNWLKNKEAFWDTTKPFLGDVVNFIVSLYNLFSTDDEDGQDAALADVIGSLQSMAAKVEDAGIVSSGTHASGFLSHGVRSAAAYGTQLLNEHMPTGDVHSDEFLRIEQILRATFSAMDQLPTEGHDPWLRAEWQVEYVAIVDAAATQLELMRQE